jgi:hypothetical protein
VSAWATKAGIAPTCGSSPQSQHRPRPGGNDGPAGPQRRPPASANGRTRSRPPSLVRPSCRRDQSACRSR